MRRIVLGISLTLLFGLQACGEKKNPVKNASPLPEAETTLTDFEGPTFLAEIKPIFEKRCASCHIPGGGLPDWSDYQIAYNKRNAIALRLKDGTMPPQGSALDAHEKELILTWIDAGAPQRKKVKGGSVEAPPQVMPDSSSATKFAEQNKIIKELEAQIRQLSDQIVLMKSAKPTPNFEEDIKPIMMNTCVNAGCHNPQINFPTDTNWEDYNQIRAKLVVFERRVIVEKTMPPRGSDQDPAELMSDVSRDLIGKWLSYGAPKTSAEIKDPAAVNREEIARLRKLIDELKESTEFNEAWIQELEETISDLEDQIAELETKIADKNEEKDPGGEEPVDPDPQDDDEAIARGKALAGQKGCTGCHGDAGDSESSMFPKLASQFKEYLAIALTSYQNGSRTSPFMSGPANGLAEQEIDDIALYFSKQTIATPAGGGRGDMDMGREKALRCAECHGVNGSSANVIFPNLSGQHADYIETSLKAYRDQNGRTDNRMIRETANLTDQDIKDLATWYSSQEPNF